MWFLTIYLFATAALATTGLDGDAASQALRC